MIQTGIKTPYRKSVEFTSGIKNVPMRMNNIGLEVTKDVEGRHGTLTSFRTQRNNEYQRNTTGYVESLTVYGVHFRSVLSPQ